MKHIEMIVDYVTDGTDYQYCDNHGVLIRCKDCKYCVTHPIFERSDKWCERLCDEYDRSLARITEDNDFCSYAERRQDG